MKRKILNLSVLLLLLAFACRFNPEPAAKDETVFQLHIEGQKYPRLSMIVSTNQKKEYINGISADSSNWEFHIPDTVWERSGRFRIFSAPDSADSITPTIQFAFRMDSAKDSIFYGNIGFPKKQQPGLTVRFLKSHPIQLPVYDSQKKTVVNETYISDNYDIAGQPDEEIRLSVSYLGEFDQKDGEKTYPEWIGHYTDIARQHPDSRTLMQQLYMSAYRFKRTDLEKVYLAFSDSLRENSHFGRKLNNYLYHMSFRNSMEPNALTGIPEWVRLDSSRFNLLIFSASWCRPCHELIPLLKEMHNDLGDRLVMTYITKEREETLPAWKALMEKEEIPWRSLWIPDEERVYETYGIRAIPHCVLIAPDGNMQQIDVRKEKERVYDAVKKTS